MSAGLSVLAPDASDTLELGDWFMRLLLESREGEGFALFLPLRLLPVPFLGVFADGVDCGNRPSKVALLSCSVGEVRGCFTPHVVLDDEGPVSESGVIASSLELVRISGELCVEEVVD